MWNNVIFGRIDIFPVLLNKRPACYYSDANDDQKYNYYQQLMNFFWKFNFLMGNRYFCIFVQITASFWDQPKT